MTRRRRLWAVAVLVVTLVAPGACGGGGDEAATGGSTSTSVAGPGDGCLLDEAAVGDAVGGRVSAAGPVAGGSGGSGAGGSDYGLSWKGCAFTNADGDEVQVAELVDDGGASDVSGFEQLVALAAEVEGPDVEGLGDEAFADDSQIVARSGDVTFLLGFGAGAEAATGELDALAEVGRDLIAEVDAADAEVDAADAGAADAGAPVDVDAVCASAAALVPAEWEPVGAPSTGSAEGLAAGLDYSYDECTVPLLDGDAALVIGLAAAEVYDARVAAEGPTDDEAAMVEGLGDEAVRLDGALYVKVGGRALRVEAESASGQPLGDDVVDALGSAAADELA